MTSPELENLVRLGHLKRESCYIVFQALAHTLSLPAETWWVLAKAHERRNLAEYEGVLDMDERLLTDVIAAARVVLKGVKGLPPLEVPKKKP